MSAIKRSSSSPRPAPPFNEYDVLCGSKLKAYRENGGNLFLLQEATECLKEHDDADAKSDFLDKGVKRDRKVIKREILEKIKSRGGRFLKLLDKKSQKWEEMSEKEAIAKITNAFKKVRERQKLAASVDSASMATGKKRKKPRHEPPLPTPRKPKPNCNRDDQSKINFSKIFLVFNINPGDRGPKRIMNSFGDTLEGVRLLMAFNDEEFAAVLQNYNFCCAYSIHLRQFRQWFNTQYVPADEQDKPGFTRELWLEYREQITKRRVPDSGPCDSELEPPLWNFDPMFINPEYFPGNPMEGKDGDNDIESPADVIDLWKESPLGGVRLAQRSTLAVGDHEVPALEDTTAGHLELRQGCYTEHASERDSPFAGATDWLKRLVGGDTGGDTSSTEHRLKEMLENDSVSSGSRRSCLNDNQDVGTSMDFMDDEFVKTRKGAFPVRFSATTTISSLGEHVQEEASERQRHPPSARKKSKRMQRASNKTEYKRKASAGGVKERFDANCLEIEFQGAANEDGHVPLPDFESGSFSSQHEPNEETIQVPETLLTSFFAQHRPRKILESKLMVMEEELESKLMVMDRRQSRRKSKSKRQFGSVDEGDVSRSSESWSLMGSKISSSNRSSSMLGSEDDLSRLMQDPVARSFASRNSHRSDASTSIATGSVSTRMSHGGMSGVSHAATSESYDAKLEIAIHLEKSGVAVSSAGETYDQDVTTHQPYMRSNIADPYGDPDGKMKRPVEGAEYFDTDENYDGDHHRQVPPTEEAEFEEDSGDHLTAEVTAVAGISVSGTTIDQIEKHGEGPIHDAPVSADGLGGKNPFHRTTWFMLVVAFLLVGGVVGVFLFLVGVSSDKARAPTPAPIQRLD